MLSNKSKNRAKGIIGETKALNYLKSNGYKIIKQNYTCAIGEIDIIAEKDKIKITTVLDNVSMTENKINCKFMACELFIKRNKQQFNYIFCDPPFPYQFHQDLVKQCALTNALTDDGILMIHHPAEKKLDEKIANLIRYDQRFFGRSIVDFYKKNLD